MPARARKPGKDYDSPSPAGKESLPHQDWGDLIPDEQWAIYSQVIRLAHERGLRFALGGAFGLATYSQRWRNSKDMDLYVAPEDTERMKQVLTGCGLTDYYDQLPYDRGWIWRGIRDGVIVDIIFAMANQRAVVDEAWLTRGPCVELRGERLRILPPEELIWAKLYVLQKDRCDWPDIMNILHAAGRTLDWDYLLARVGEDSALLGGLVSAFAWLCPKMAEDIPKPIWNQLQSNWRPSRNRIQLLDSRPWFRGEADIQSCQ